MVRRGNFAVELVSVDTKAPFKEHMGPDGNVYAEVEPDMEYFVNFYIDNVGKEISVTIKVDGECLGYRTHVWSAPGRWVVTNGIRQHGAGLESLTALRFEKTGGVSRSGGHSFGSVQVTFNELYVMDNLPLEQQRDPVNPWVGGRAFVDAAISETTNKVVTSKKGFETIFNTQVPWRSSFEMWTIETIEIRYCTAVGLIMVGVLPTPPGWENRDGRVQRVLPRSMKNCLAVEPMSIVLTNANVAWGQKEVRADCFDLVEADVSDEE